MERFSQKLNLWEDKNGAASRTVRDLLDFAGYKERGGEIETASHYREVKKLTGATNKEPETEAQYRNLGKGTESTSALERSKMPTLLLVTSSLHTPKEWDFKSLTVTSSLQAE